MQLISATQILRYPRLDTVLMVEKVIQEHDGEFTRKQLWNALPKKMMYQTFQVILAYLYQSNKISIDSEGKVGWISYSERVGKRINAQLVWKG